MSIRFLLPAISLVANIAAMPALAQQAPAADPPAAERTLQQNRRVALPYSLEERAAPKEAQLPRRIPVEVLRGTRAPGLAMR